MRNIFEQGSWKVPSSADAELRQYDCEETIKEIQELVSHLYRIGVITTIEHKTISDTFGRLKVDYKGDK